MRNDDPLVQKVIARINRDRRRARHEAARQSTLLASAAGWTFGDKVIVALLIVLNIGMWSWIWQHDAASHRALEAQGEHEWHETR